MRRTRRCDPIKPEVLVIGVDVAKAAHLALAVSWDGSSAKPLKLAVNRNGFAQLQAYAEEHAKRTGAAGWVVALEPTGHYGMTLLSWLLARGVTVYSVQPSSTNKAKTLYDGTNRKTDAKDALVIASLCRQGLCQVARLPKGAFAELRTLAVQRGQLVKHRSQVVNRLHRYVDVLFPELLELFKNIEGLTILWLLTTMPTPTDVLKWNAVALAAQLSKVSRGQLGKARAEQLLEAAERSIGITHGLDSHRLAVGQLVEELQGVMAQIRNVEVQMKATLREVPYARLLLTIPRIGAVTVATLLGELGDLKGYRHWRQVVAMAGLDLVEQSSGQRIGHHHISRRGRGYARQLLYLAALRLGRKTLAEPRRRQVEDRKKPATKATVANMARLLRMMFAIARDGKPFDATLMKPKAMPMAA